MQANRAVETRPEKDLRQALWLVGLRGYRKNVNGLPGRPDIVFSRSRLCIFVHGCFWHGCDKCPDGRVPNENSAFWVAKRAANSERDSRKERVLQEQGYSVHVVWACELAKQPDAVVSRILELLGYE